MANGLKFFIPFESLSPCQNTSKLKLTLEVKNKYEERYTTTYELSGEGLLEESLQIDSQYLGADLKIGQKLSLNLKVAEDEVIFPME